MTIITLSEGTIIFWYNQEKQKIYFSGNCNDVSKESLVKFLKNITKNLIKEA